MIATHSVAAKYNSQTTEPCFKYTFTCTIFVSILGACSFWGTQSRGLAERGQEEENEQH